MINHIVRILWIFFATGFLHFTLNSCTKDPIIESESATSIRGSIGGSTEILLSDNAQALHYVVIPNGALEYTRNAAQDLAKYLSHITGGDFMITVGDGTKGIAVGTYKDFPQLGLEDLFNPKIITRQDEYLLRTHANGIYLIGATDLAAQHAVWGFLNQIGYRQFFPTPSWESIPKTPNLSVGVDVFEQPDFYVRKAPETAPYTDVSLWENWHDRNLMTSSFNLWTSHAYDAIIIRNKTTFDKHPEYYALVNGERYKGKNAKFCISNEGLRRLVVEDSKSRVQKEPDIMSINLDPSDGGNWCECQPCAEMGSITDRVVILANESAEAINKMGYGEKYVGILAYNQHSAPPTIDVHPKVIVSIATNFIRGGYTLGELLEEWSKSAEMTGIYGYHDVSSWSFGMPRKARGGDVNHLVERTTYFYNQGVRFAISEAADSWGVNGLGYYLSAPFLWNVDAVNRVDGIIEDFLERSFKEAKEPMRKFYYMINQDYVTPRTNNDLLAHMYGYINDARKLTKDSGVLTRLGELAQYTRHVENWFKFELLKGNDRQKAAQDLYRHAYRMQDLMMVNIWGLNVRLRGLGVEIPTEIKQERFKYGSPLEDMPPWQSSATITEGEITQFIEDGIANYKKDSLDFNPVSYSEDLIPAAEILGLPRVSTGDFGRNNQFSSHQKMFTWFSSDNKQLRLEVTGGLIAHYRDRGNVRFKLFSPKEALVEPVDTDESVPPDGETYNVTLTSPYDGVHELEWDDGSDITRLKWTEGIPMTVRSSMNDPAKIGNNRKLYFYVPKGTKVVGGFTSGDKVYGYTRVHDASGTQVYAMSDVEGGEGYFSIPVVEGQDGKLWSFQRGYGIQVLMTVPPYLARNEKELLLPKEIVEADKLN